MCGLCELLCFLVGCLGSGAVVGGICCLAYIVGRQYAVSVGVCGLFGLKVGVRPCYWRNGCAAACCVGWGSAVQVPRQLEAHQHPLPPGRRKNRGNEVVEHPPTGAERTGRPGRRWRRRGSQHGGGAPRECRWEQVRCVDVTVCVDAGVCASTHAFRGFHDASVGYSVVRVWLCACICARV